MPPSTDDLHFDLKRPCADCPFRKGAAFHGGVAKRLYEYFGESENGTLVHTCHKTDPRSDCEEAKAYKGKLQHCAGLLLMMNKNADLLGQEQVRALESGRWKYLEMDFTVDVFKDLSHMARHYYKLMKEKYGDRIRRIEAEAAAHSGRGDGPLT